MATKKFGSSWRGTVAAIVGTHRRFEQLVAEALDEIPEEFRRALDNVEVVIEDEGAPGVLGLYHGIPLTSRGSSYAGVLPDRISIYRKTIEAMAADDAALRKIVRDTVVHELAHHFGIDDDRLRELGRD